MEFIPLKSYRNKNAKEVRKAGNKKVRNFEKVNDQGLDIKNVKRKPQINLTKKQSVKDKCKEISVLKKKKANPKGRFVKRKNEEEEEEKEEDGVLNAAENYDESDGEENNVDDNQNEEEEDEDNEDRVLKEKIKKLDEKKKNRLFLKLKKKIYSDAQIKELHPDIRSVIFPRKKNSRWCWAVFASEEKADKAMTQLVKNKDIFVNKPTPYENVILRRKQKMKTVLRKKEARKKLQDMWT